MLAWLFTSAIVLGTLAYRFGFPLYAWLTTPASDVPRLKRDLEGAGRRVVSIRRTGFEYGGRHGPHFRKYEVVIENDALGRSVTRTVGVEATLVSDGEFKIYKFPAANF